MIRSWGHNLRFNDVYSALKAVGELALSTTTREHLGLNHSTLTTYKTRIDRSDKRPRYTNSDRRTGDLVESLNSFLG